MALILLAAEARGSRKGDWGGGVVVLEVVSAGLGNKLQNKSIETNKGWIGMPYKNLPVGSYGLTRKHGAME